MAISQLSSQEAVDSRTPLLQDTVDGAVDHKGQPVRRSNSGGWKSAYFIIGELYFQRFNNFIKFDSIPSGLFQCVNLICTNIYLSKKKKMYGYGQVWKLQRGLHTMEFHQT